MSQTDQDLTATIINQELTELQGESLSLTITEAFFLAKYAIWAARTLGVDFSEPIPADRDLHYVAEAIFKCMNKIEDKSDVLDGILSDWILSKPKTPDEIHMAEKQHETKIPDV